MNIRHKRHADIFFFQRGEHLSRFHVRHGQAEDLAACRLQGARLAKRFGKIMRIGVCHRLNGNRMIATDRNAADENYARGSSLNLIFHNAFSFLNDAQPKS